MKKKLFLLCTVSLTVQQSLCANRKSLAYTITGATFGGLAAATTSKLIADSIPRGIVIGGAITGGFLAWLWKRNVSIFKPQRPINYQGAQRPNRQQHALAIPAQLRAANGNFVNLPNNLLLRGANGRLLSEEEQYKQALAASLEQEPQIRNKPLLLPYGTASNQTQKACAEVLLLGQEPQRHNEALLLPYSAASLNQDQKTSDSGEVVLLEYVEPK